MAATAAAAATSVDKAKSITRLLQHSILQLCNEHIGYTHKLQILGVLCMTVDDEQQELVVKVNNTLKRVSPSVPARKDTPPSVSPMPNALPAYNNHPMTSTEMDCSTPDVSTSRNSAVSAADSPSQASTPPSSQSGRRSHGRKRTNPVKVHHVYDEGDMASEDEITTVIPTDPDSEALPSSVSEGVTFTNSTPLSVPSFKPAHSPATPNQRLLSGGESRVVGSARRKTSYYLRQSTPSSKTINDKTSNSDSVSQADDTNKTPVSISASSTVRALLMGARNSYNGISTQGKTHNITPICVAPDGTADSSDSDNNCDAVDDEMDDSITEQIVKNHSSRHVSMIELGGESDSSYDKDEHDIINARASYVEITDNVIRVKEEPVDDNSEPGALQIDMGEENPATPASEIDSPLVNALSVLPCPLVDGIDSVPSQVPYSNLALLANPQFAHRRSDGLSIRYTSRGPITVTANGKEVTSATKVKDIILYDDRTPLHMQKGSRIETDYMVDKMGLEGRKRRRRSPEETLTAEEVAEYLGTLHASASSFTCHLCNHETQDLTKYLQHTLVVHSAYICHQCNKSFTTKSSLLRHRPIHTGMRRFACSICKKTFYRKDKCKAHIKRHLGVSESSVLTENE